MVYWCSSFYKYKSSYCLVKKYITKKWQKYKHFQETSVNYDILENLWLFWNKIHGTNRENFNCSLFLSRLIIMTRNKKKTILTKGRWATVFCFVIFEFSGRSVRQSLSNAGT